MTLPVGGIAGFLELQGAAAFERGILGAQRSLSLTGESAVTAAAAVDKVDVALARTGAASSSASSGSAKLRAAQLSAVAATERYNTVLTDENSTLARLASTEASMIRANERLATSNASLASSQRALATSQAESAVVNSTWRAGLATTLKTAGQLGLVIGGIELARKAVEFVAAGKHLTDALNSVQAAAQATDAQMTSVRSHVIALGHDLTIPAATAVDAAEAIDDLVRSGMTLPRAMQAARSALLLASVANTDMAMSARVLGDVLDEFRLPATQAAKVANMLGAAATSTAGGLTTVFDALKYAGTRARSANIPLEDLLSAIVDLSKAGLQGTIIGTGLAQSIAKLAAPSGPGAKAIRDLGIEAFDTSGKFKGLAYLVEQVFEAQKRFGAGSQRFLKDISVAFGARAANAIAGFAGKGIEGLDRFKTRLDSFDLQTAANQMNRGLGAAFRQLGKEATAVGIDLYQKLGPSLASAATWLGTNLPRAISQLQSFLAPLEHNIGFLLVAAWKAFAAAAGVAGTVLGAIAHAAEAVKGPLTTVATVALAMWGAFKGYTIATAAITAVQLRLSRLAATAPYALASIGKSASGLAAGLSPAMTALAGIGLILGSAITQSHKHSAALEEEKQRVQQLTDAINEDKGALGAHTRAIVEDALQSSGAYDAARQLHLSLKDVTDAALGNADALGRVEKQAGLNAVTIKLLTGLDEQGRRAILGSSSATDKRWAAMLKLNEALSLNNSAVRDAVQATKNLAAADRNAASTTETAAVNAKDLARANKETKLTIDGTTYAMKGQSTAADILNAALARLSGDKNAVAESQLALKDSLASVTAQIKDQAKQYKDSGTSLDANTEEGRKNLEWLHQQVDQINAVASAQIKAHASTQTVTNTLAKNEKALRKTAVAAGLGKKGVEEFIKQFAAKPKDLELYIKANTDDAATKALELQHKLDFATRLRDAAIKVGDPLGILHAQEQLDALTAPRLVPVTVAVDASQLNKLDQVLQGVGFSVKGSGRKGFASGTGPGGMPDGWAWVGNELVRKSGSRVDVLNASRSKVVAPMLGMGSPEGFRGAGSSGGKHVHLHGDVNLVAHYPEQEKDTTAFARMRQQFAEQLGSYVP